MTKLCSICQKPLRANKVAMFRLPHDKAEGRPNAVAHLDCFEWLRGAARELKDLPYLVGADSPIQL